MKIISSRGVGMSAAKLLVLLSRSQCFFVLKRVFPERGLWLTQAQDKLTYC